MSFRMLYSRNAPILQAFRSRATFRTSRPARGMASDTKTVRGFNSADKPWLITAALITIPSVLYIMRPPPKDAHGAHSDRHPSGHGSAPAPIMQKVLSTTEPSPQPVIAEGKAQSHVGEGEHAQGDAPRNVPGDDTSATKLGDKTYGDSESGPKSTDSSDANSSSSSDSTPGKDSEEPTKEEINASIEREMDADAPKTAKKVEEKQARR